MAHAGGRPVGSKRVNIKVNYIFTNKANKLIQYKVAFYGEHYHIETITNGISEKSHRIPAKELFVILEENCGKNFINLFVRVFGKNRAVSFYLKKREGVING